MDWVVQADCPEDVPCYIHRVGRTARYTAEGRGLLLLTPSEAAFAKELAAAKVGEAKKPKTKKCELYTPLATRRVGPELTRQRSCAEDAAWIW